MNQEQLDRGAAFVQVRNDLRTQIDTVTRVLMDVAERHGVPPWEGEVFCKYCLRHLGHWERAFHEAGTEEWRDIVVLRMIAASVRFGELETPFKAKVAQMLQTFRLGDECTKEAYLRDSQLVLELRTLLSPMAEALIMETVPAPAIEPRAPEPVKPTPVRLPRCEDCRLCMGRALDRDRGIKRLVDHMAMKMDLMAHSIEEVEFELDLSPDVTDTFYARCSENLAVWKKAADAIEDPAQKEKLAHTIEIAERRFIELALPILDRTGLMLYGVETPLVLTRANPKDTESDQHPEPSVSDQGERFSRELASLATALADTLSVPPAIRRTVVSRCQASNLVH